MTDIQSEWLSRYQAAAYLNIKIRTLDYRRVTSRLLRAAERRDGKLVFFSRAGLDRYREAQKVERPGVIDRLRGRA